MILYVLYVTVMVVLLFGVTIFAHEFGHFLAARWCGMVIEVFSIGFGPAVWKRKYKGVIYKIGWIPVGGYVALPQMDPSEPQPPDRPNESQKADNGSESGASAETGKETAVIPPPAAPWKKILVAFAGAAGNIILAVLLAWIVYWTGKPSTPAERCAVIGFVETNSAAYTNGLRIGDEILTVNGFAVSNWNDVLQEIARFESVAFTVRAPAGIRTLTVPTERNVVGFRMVDGLREISLCRVMSVEKDSSADQAGIRSGDLVTEFDGEKVLSIEHLIALTSARPDTRVSARVERDGSILPLEVTPHLDATLGRARIGIRFDPLAVDYDKVVHIPPGVQLRSHATAILRVVRSLVTPREARATSEGLGGPIMIIYMLQDMVRKGLIIALWFICFLNVNLAIVNLLPIPVLDGGHILFALWEMATRRPVHPKVAQWIYQVFVALLVAAFVFLTYRDTFRFVQIFKITRSLTARTPPTNGAPGEISGTNAFGEK